LLLRFWEPQSGTIRLDGVDVRDVPADVSRSLVSVVAQRDHLFDTSVRDNLRLADAEATDERLMQACAAVGFDRVIESLDRGLDARVGENGSSLSGGQRQQLMIARALLAEAPVLVLDEACTHLDADTESAVLAGVSAWRAGRTTIHIVHDARTLGPVDLTLFVAGGGITTRSAW
jgi:ATP-binding cassette subfamily C protein CydCD